MHETKKDFFLRNFRSSMVLFTNSDISKEFSHKESRSSGNLKGVFKPEAYMKTENIMTKPKLSFSYRSKPLISVYEESKKHRIGNTNASPITELNQKKIDNQQKQILLKRELRSKIKSHNFKTLIEKVDTSQKAPKFKFDPQLLSLYAAEISSSIEEKMLDEYNKKHRISKMKNALARTLNPKVKEPPELYKSSFHDRKSHEYLKIYKETQDFLFHNSRRVVSVMGNDVKDILQAEKRYFVSKKDKEFDMEIEDKGLKRQMTFNPARIEKNNAKMTAPPFIHRKKGKKKTTRVYAI